MKIQDKEIIYTKHHKVKCEGKEDGSGHPLIYMEIKEEQIDCPYCSRVFKLKK